MIRDLADFIVVTEPVLPDDAVENIFATLANVVWRTPAHMGYERTCVTFPVSAAAVEDYPSPPGLLARVKRADNDLLEAAQKAVRMYKQRYPELHTTADQGFDILRYDAGQLIGYHADDHQPRVLSLSLALNDDYEGGEFRFWQDDNARVRVPRGCAIMFPPSFMYPHEILPITAGARYSMITWYV